MDDNIQKAVCRHLIGIGWYEGTVNNVGEFVTKPTYYGASGFVLQLHDDLPGSWALITAGHVFTEYKERLSDPKMAAKNHSLLDVWGPHSVVDHRIPFDLFDTPAFVMYDKDAGLDFAVVPLPDLIRKLIAQTTIPFTRTNWIHQPNISFDSYKMLGLPREVAEEITSHEDGIESITTFPTPALLSLEPCKLPNDITPAANPQFVATIDANVDLDSIKGMSGGPIFGFRTNADGQSAYWPIAIQSRWVKRLRIVIGSSIPPIAARIEQDIAHFLATKPKQ